MFEKPPITSSLRPLEPSGMRSGERICSADGLQELTFIAGPDVSGRVVVVLNGAFVMDDPANLRLAPLGWIERKPVYSLDRLFNKIDGRAYTVTGDAGHETFRTHEARADGAYALCHEDATWGTVTGEEKTFGQLAYEAAAEYNGDIRPWVDANQGAWEVAAQAVATALQSPK